MKKFLLAFLFLCWPYLNASAEIDALPVKEVAPGIFVHFGPQQIPDKRNHGAVANIGFIVGERCVAVIDSGGNPEQGLALLKAIKKHSLVPICYVINTHVHPDHIYGNSAFQKPGVKFVGHEKLARAMAMRGPFYIDKAAELLGVTLTEENFIAPDLEVKNLMKLDLGGRKLTLTAHSTAHTDNDLSIYDAKTDTLWLADLLFLDHIPVIDGSLKGWINELQRLQNRQVKTVIPGHGPVVTDWPKSMQPQLAYLQMLLDEIRVAIKQGVYLEDAVQTVGASAKDQWLLFDQFHRRNVTTAFAELEWED